MPRFALMFLVLAMLCHENLAAAALHYPSAPVPGSGLPDARPTAVPRAWKPGPESAQADSAHSFDVTRYRLDLDVPCAGTYLSGACSIRLKAVGSTLLSVPLDFVGLVADTVYQDGVVAGFTTTPSRITVNLPSAVAPGDSTLVRIAYHGNCIYGFYQAYPETWFTFTEPSDARYWFPCFDQPYDKAAAELHITVPDTMVVASNGVQTSPPTLNAALHKQTYHWGTNYPVATYLVSFAVAHYVRLDQVSPSVPVYSYVLKADSAKAAYDFGNVPDMLEFYGSIWGPYAFEKYGMAATKNFGGGMEHQTMTTITRNWITGDRKYEWAIAHELSHQWWGDMVTPVDWPHIWLNEGFASYGDLMYAEHAYGTAGMRARMATWATKYFSEDSLRRYPLYNPPADKLFGLTIYYKGAWVLHTLRHLMGDSAFVRGWRDYGEAHKYGNAGVADFQASMEAQHGSSLAEFFVDWVYGSGYPTYGLTRNSVPRLGGGFYNYFSMGQNLADAPFFHTPVDVLLHTTAGDTLVQITPAQSAVQSQITTRGSVLSAVIDPDGWVLHRNGPSGGSIGVPGLAGDGLRILPPRIGPGVAEVAFSLPSGLPAEKFELAVHDVQGRRVATLWKGAAGAGTQTVRWDGETNVGRAHGGIYFLRLASPSRAATARLILLR